MASSSTSNRPTMTKVDLTAQKVSFVNKIGIILKATSDDEEPTQAYLFKEIIAMSYESVGYSESLVEFLIDRLRNKSCHVKYKVLKVLKHLCEHGSSEVKLGLLKTAEAIKECMKYGGPPHPLHGNVPYNSVRKLAKEVCEILYGIDPLAVKAEQPEHACPRYGGLGSSRSGSTALGFGNSPALPNKGLGETILEGIEKLGARITESAEDRQAALLAQLNLSASTSNYQPPVVIQDDIPVQTDKSVDHTDENFLVIKEPVKRQPGKPGGGWNDDDDDDLDEEEKDNENCLSKEPSFTEFHHESSNQDLSLESKFVEDFVVHGSTGKFKVFLAPSDLRRFHVQLDSYCCFNILEIIAEVIAGNDMGKTIRSLQLLESIIFNRVDLVNIESIATICSSAIENCYKIVTETHTRKTSENKDINFLSEEKQDFLLEAMKLKLLKIILFFQQISSFSNYVIPRSDLKSLVTNG